MWKAVLLVTFGCLLIDEAKSQGGAESLSFHGHLPEEYVKAKKPDGDDGPNDIYGHLPVRTPKLLQGEIVIYPHHFGFEFGQDPEGKVYEIHNAHLLAASNQKNHLQKQEKHLKQLHHKLDEPKGKSISDSEIESSVISNPPPHPSYPSPPKKSPFLKKAFASKQ